jgi:YD repeat-containing protein
MEQKPHSARKTVRTVARVASRERRCSQNGKLTAAYDGAIRVSTEPSPQPLPRGRVEVVETYFDAGGRPIKRKSIGAARVARAYDARGNQVEEAYFNAVGKPTVAKESGAARIAWSYDERGNRLEAAFFAVDGTPITRPGAARKDVRDGV